LGLATVKTSFKGRWRIVETSLWDEDAIDLLEPAYVEFESNRLGSMVVGALQAGIDYRVGTRDGQPAIEFSWIGDDDLHPASGRGWAQLEADGRIRVQLYIHQGDDVVMFATHTTSPSRPQARRTPARRGPRRVRR